MSKALKILSALVRPRSKEEAKSPWKMKGLDTATVKFVEGTSLWRRLAIKIPSVSKICPFGQVHWFYADVCFCGLGKRYSAAQLGAEWHGGVFIWSLNQELHFCSSCVPDAALVSQQYAITDPEAVLLAHWRTYQIKKKLSTKLPTTAALYAELVKFQTWLADTVAEHLGPPPAGPMN